MGQIAIGTVSNPFSTRAVRPGSIRFRFPSASGPQLLLEKLADHAWWGEITGPHGSGKTTLLETLATHLQQTGRHLVRFELHSGQSSLRYSEQPWTSWNTETQVIVDGYEQLSWPSRWLLQRRCRRQQCGLLITAHHPTGLPPVFRTQVTRELAQQLVNSLLPPNCGIICVADIDRCFDRHAGNLRETLFALYDVYETGRVSRAERLDLRQG